MIQKTKFLLLPFFPIVHIFGQAKFGRADIFCQMGGIGMITDTEIDKSRVKRWIK